MGRQEEVERVKFWVGGLRTIPASLKKLVLEKQLLLKVLLKGLPSGQVPEILNGKVCIKLFTI